MKFSLTALLALCLTLPLAAESPFEFKEINATGLQLSENGKPAFVYNFGMVLAPGYPEKMARSCYMHPVYAPDGTVVTDDFQKVLDHPHHRGIFWAWEVVTVDGKTDDVWTVKGFKQKFVAWKARDTAAATAHVAVENGWYDGERKFVKENVDIVALATVDNQRALDFTLSFEAVDKPVIIVGTPDGKKGYGGFALRMRQRDGGKTEIDTAKGILAKDGVLERTPWAQLSGQFDGKFEGARIVDDASNPGSPKNGWLLRHSFGLMNVSYPGLEPLTLEAGKPLVLKYKVIVFSGKKPKD